MSAECKFVPMSDANTWRLRTTATLPFQLHEKVGLNVGAIERLCQVAGFRHLRIQNDPNGETSQAIPQVVGFDARGAAIAGKAAFKEVPTSQFDYSPGLKFERGFKQARWKNLTVSLNTQEMKQRILRSDGKVTDSEEWGRETDKALKRAVIKSGTRHLVCDFDCYDKGMALLVYSLISTWTAFLARGGKVDLGPYETAGVFILYTVVFGAYTTAWGSSKYGKEKSGEGQRAGLIFGPEIDRAITLAVLTYTSKLAKGIPEDK